MSSILPKRTLLIDGDTVAFIASAASQEIIDWDGNHLPYARLVDGQTIVDNILGDLKLRLKGTDIKVFLSCPSADNWRLQVFPDYKANRAKSQRPLLLDPLKQYLRASYGATHYAYLEADDALGVFATHPTLIEGEKVVVGRDKDFKTIPGLHYQLKDDDEQGKPIIRLVTLEAAATSHMAQSLSGDAVDGFPGCPGFGVKRAYEVVEVPDRLVPKQGVITRGKAKGEEVTKWFSSGPCSMWEAVVCRYEKAGLTEADALRTARLAKILLAEDYNMETQEVRLWVPPRE